MRQVRLDRVEESMIIPMFKAYDGLALQNMIQLGSEGRVPLSVYEIMLRRLELKSGSNEVREAWNENFCTRDAVLYHPNGDVKIAPDFVTQKLGKRLLDRVRGEVLNDNGSLKLSQRVYDSIGGTVIPKKELRGRVCRELGKKSVLNNPVWNILAKADSGLLEAYTDYVFQTLGIKTGMEVEFVNEYEGDGKHPQMMLVGIDGCVSKGALSDKSLDTRTLAVGMVDLKECSKAIKCFEKKQYNQEDLDRFDKVIKELEGVIHTELLFALRGLRNRL